jgi:excinuclease UvrABC nuclease subunit
MYKLILGFLIVDFFVSESKTDSVGKITSQKMRIAPAPAKLIRKKTGCYIVKGKKTVVLVGFGDDVYHTVNSHFDGTNEKQYNSNHEVEILLTRNLNEAELLYYGLVKRLKPMDYDGSYSSIKITEEMEELLKQYDGIA